MSVVVVLWSLHLHEFLLITVASAIIVTLLFYYMYAARSGRKTTIPGLEPSDPNDGNLGDIKNAGSLYEFLSELHATYGPIVSFYWGKQLNVSIASPELFKEHSQVFDRPGALFEIYVPLITFHSIQFANGMDGRERRKHYDAAFSHTYVIKYYETIEKVAKDTVDDLITVPKDEAISLMESMLALTIKSISVVGFGDFFDKENVAKLVHMYETSWTEIENRLREGIPHPGDPRNDKVAKERDNMFALIRQAMDHRRAHPRRPDEQQLIDLIMDSGKPEAVQFADAISYFIGGFHTTGTLLTWCIYYLCTHRDVEDKLLQELKDVLKGKEVTASNWTDLVYMRQVLDETLRCSQLSPFAARVQDTDSKLGGHVIPAKTPVIHSLAIMSYDKKYWPNPEKFDPDRFQKKPVSFTFVPFGFSGGRKCPAYQFAYIEATIALSVLLPSVKFTLKEGQDISKYYGLVIKPNPEIWVHTERRL